MKMPQLLQHKWLKRALVLVLLPLLYAFFCMKLSSLVIDNDSVQYLRYAQNLVASGVYGSLEGQPGIPDMDREPGYGVFHGLVFKAVPSVAGNLPQEIALMTFAQAWLSALVIALLILFLPLPRRTRILYGIFLLSPGAMLGANVEILSETIAVSCLGLFILGMALHFETKKIAYAFLAGLAFTGALLTKAYLFYFVPFFALFAVWSWSKNLRPLVVSLVVVIVCALVGHKWWSLRNERLFGDNQTYVRVAAAAGGKIIRAEDIDPVADFVPAHLAAVGANLCGKFYTNENCIRFTILSVDKFGLPDWARVRDKGPNHRAAFRIYMRELADRYLQHVPRQLFSSWMETVRIFFYESPPAGLHSWGIPMIVLQVWHVVGSLVFWAFALLALRTLKAPADGGVERALLLVSFLFVVVHFILMSQVGNMTRYAFPMLPFIYLMAAIGLEKKIPRWF